MAHTSKKASAKKAATKPAKKAAQKPAKKATRKDAAKMTLKLGARKGATRKPGAKKAPTKRVAARKLAAKKAAAKKAAAKKVALKSGALRKVGDHEYVDQKSASKKSAAGGGQTGRGAGGGPDFAEFPAGAVTRYSTLVCLACVFDLFTKQLGLAPRTAYAEIRRYAPSAEELTAPARQRPFFESADKTARCPYCDAARRWHARLDTYRVEGGKGTDAARKKLFASLPESDEQFQIFETKRAAREVFFEWLDALGRRLDFESDDHEWMLGATRAFLERREPKTDWSQVFEGLRQVRRSQRLEEGWERDGARLFLAPPLYNDALLVQYLVSRSHRHGGRTLEGRLTLPEFVRRLRFAGHLDAQGITDRDQFDVLEKLVEQLTGGDRPVRLHYLVDRRDLLDKVKTAYESSRQ